jgi:hypothetical protein
MEINTPIVNSCTGLFNFVVCRLCRKMLTQHHCLECVVDGGLPHNGDMVCGSLSQGMILLFRGSSLLLPALTLF